MEIKPIRTKADHRAALKAVEVLMAVRPGTRDGERLDVLVTLIEAYERKHFPMELPDPIEAIRFSMEQKRPDSQGPRSDDRPDQQGLRNPEWKAAADAADDSPPSPRTGNTSGIPDQRDGRTAGGLALSFISFSPASWRPSSCLHVRHPVTIVTVLSVSCVKAMP